MCRECSFVFTYVTLCILVVRVLCFDRVASQFRLSGSFTISDAAKVKEGSHVEASLKAARDALQEKTSAAAKEKEQLEAALKEARNALPEHILNNVSLTGVLDTSPHRIKTVASRANLTLETVGDFRYCVVSRYLHEAPYLTFWLDWYRRLGFTRFYIQTHNFSDFEIADVEIIKLQRPIGEDFGIMERALRRAASFGFCRWTLAIDFDEFLILRNHVGIESYLNSVPYQVNSIEFRWAMHEQLEPVCGPVHLTKMYTNWNMKHMFITKSMNRWTNSHGVNISDPWINWRAGRFQSPAGWRGGRPPQPGDSYEEAILLHIHTRSISNMLVKWATTQFRKKAAKNNIVVRKLFSGPLLPILDDYIGIVGPKLRLPLRHTSASSFAYDIHMDPFCDVVREQGDSLYFLGPDASRHVQHISMLLKTRVAKRRGRG